MLPRKLLPVILATLALGQGCGPGYPPGTIVLHVANWGGAKEGTEDDKRVEAIYREFERQNPGVRIQEESVPLDYVAKMSLAYIAKAQPEVMMLDLSSAALFIDSKMVADLRPYIAADKDFHCGDYFPNVFNAATRDEAVYALPNDFTPVVMYYNKRLFDQAHVPYPKADWNFVQFRETAQKLTIQGDRKGDAPKQYGYAFKNWPAGWVMLIWNKGGDYLSQDPIQATGHLDSKEAVETVTFLRDLVNDGYAPSISETASAGVDLFSNAQAAMVASGHWSLLDYKHAPKDAQGRPKITWDDIGVAPLPHDIPQSQTVMYESGYAMSALCKHKDLAWKFIKFMTSYYAQHLYQMSGIAVCARKDVAEERAKASALEASFLPLISSCRPPYGSRIEGYEVVEDQITKAMDSVLQSGRDPFEALHKSALQIDREFAK